MWVIQTVDFLYPCSFVLCCCRRIAIVKSIVKTSRYVALYSLQYSLLLTKVRWTKVIYKPLPLCVFSKNAATDFTPPLSRWCQHFKQPLLLCCSHWVYSVPQKKCITVNVRRAQTCKFLAALLFLPWHKTLLCHFSEYGFGKKKDVGKRRQAANNLLRLKLAPNGLRTLRTVWH